MARIHAPRRFTPSQVHIREVGPRDGLQNESVLLRVDQKVALIHALADAGLRLIEVGAFVRSNTVPQMADTADVFAAVQRREGVEYSAIVPNAVGARRAAAARADALQAFLSASESHNQSNVNMAIAGSLAQAADIAAISRAAGLRFEAVLSVAFGCPFEGDVSLEQVLDLAARLLDLGAEQITLGDTTGMAHPALVHRLIVAWRERFPRSQPRLHLHSARGAGLANVLAALYLGIDCFDASVGGIGGCPFAPGAPGNICTEDLVHMLHEMGIATGIRLPALIDVARMLEQMLGHTIPGQTMKAGICKHLPPDGGPIAPLAQGPGVGG